MFLHYFTTSFLQRNFLWRDSTPIFCWRLASVHYNKKHNCIWGLSRISFETHWWKPSFASHKNTVYMDQLCKYGEESRQKAKKIFFSYIKNECNGKKKIFFFHFFKYCFLFFYFSSLQQNIPDFYNQVLRQHTVKEQINKIIDHHCNSKKKIIITNK